MNGLSEPELFGRFTRVYVKIHENKYRKMKLPIPVVTSFFRSDFGSCKCIPFPIPTVTMKIDIIKIIELHLRSSPSIGSKMNVAAAPASTASPILNQNN